jgi:hypothetical protein
MVIAQDGLRLEALGGNEVNELVRCVKPHSLDEPPSISANGNCLDHTLSVSRNLPTLLDNRVSDATLVIGYQCPPQLLGVEVVENEKATRRSHARNFVDHFSMLSVVVEVSEAGEEIGDKVEAGIPKWQLAHVAANESRRKSFPSSQSQK